MFCATAALLAGPACSDDDSAPSIPVENVEDEYLNFMCQTLLDCDAGLAPLLSSVQECRDFMDAHERGPTAISEIVEEVNQGNVDYSGTLAADCLSDMEALGCDAFGSPDPESCRDVFMGSAANGDSCRLGAECTSGWCDTRNACPGECADPAADGESCANEEQCDFGLVCFNDVCEPHPGPLAAGQACDPDLEVCAYGLYCDEQTEVCTALKAGGEDCDSDSDVEECDAGLGCIEDTCVQLELVNTQGADCDPLAGQWCNPLNGIGCVIDFTDMQNLVGTTCEPLAQLGETCVDTANRLLTPCDELGGVWCDFQTQECEPQKAGGEMCEGNDECLSGLCEGMPGTCEDVECWKQ